MFNFLRKNKRHSDLKITMDFLGEHLRQLHENKDKIPTDIFDVTNFFIEESMDLYESMSILIQKNNLRGCLPIARSLLENSINLQYIYKNDTEGRAKNFKQASVASFVKRYKNLKEDFPGRKEIEKKLNDELIGYIRDKKTIREKFEEVDSKSIYIGAYKRLSEYVHSGYKAKRDLNDNGPYIQYLRRIVFSDTLLIILEALKNVCERYDLDGGVVIIKESGYKGIVFFSTNPQKEEAQIKKDTSKLIM